MNIKARTIKEWSRVFGLEIIDYDGFSFPLRDAPVCLSTFLEGVNICTVQIVDSGRYSVLDDLLK